MLLRIIIKLIIFLPAIAFSLQPENNMPILFSANQVKINHKKGIFTGNVNLDQGTTHLRADHASAIFDDNNHFLQAIIYGSNKIQAHYWGIIDKKQQYLHAYANKIIYLPKENKIKLIGNAVLIQKPNNFHAPFIEYDMINKRIKTISLSKPTIRSLSAESNVYKNSDNNIAQERTTLIFHQNIKNIK